jgi:methyl-accepting chemotaxis protein
MILATISAIGIFATGLTAIIELSRFNDTVASAFSDIQDNVETTSNINDARQGFLMQVQAWKNILLRGSRQEDFDTHLKQFTEQEGKVQYNLNKLVDDLGKSSDTYVIEIATLARTAAKDHKDLGVRYREALKSFDGNDRDNTRKIDQLVKGVDRPVTAAMTAVADKIEGYIVANNDRAQETGNHYRTVRNLLIAVMAVTLSATILFAWFIVKRVAFSVGSMTQAVNRISSDWDLSQRVPMVGSDEISRSASAVNTLLASFQTVVGKIVVSARQTAVSSQSVSDSMTRVGQSTASQSEATATVASAIEELTVSVTNVHDIATESLKVSHESSALADQGGKVIERAASEMVKIGDSVQSASQVVEQVGVQSKDISAIIAVIREVADQTNLLALNAAIEAARAGEQGRGFAVVADEVRKLAEKTTSSAQEISRMIEGIQNSSSHAVLDIRAVVTQVSATTAGAREALDAIVKIRDSARHSEKFAQQIQEALREQSQASELIAQQVEGIAHASDENASAAARAESAIRLLEEESRQLQKAVAQFVV